MQFVGLRGMHWSVSIAQLTAILIMTALRALVRRGLAKPPLNKFLDPDFELEWFSLALMDPDNVLWPTYEGDVERRDVGDWRLAATGGNTDSYSPLLNEVIEPGSSSKAHKAMMIRRELGGFMTSHAGTSVEAGVLAQAIGIALDALFGSSTAVAWSLPLRTKLVDENGHSDVFFTLRRENSKNLEPLAAELDAALSLWLFSVNQSETNRDSSRNTTFTTATSLHAQGPLRGPSLRLLSKDNESLRRDLQWWKPYEETSVLTVREVGGETEEKPHNDTKRLFEVQNHRIVGCCSRQSSTAQSSCGRTRYQSSPLPKIDFGSKHRAAISTAADGFLAVESFIPLKLLYAQQIFTAFMWSAAKVMPRCIPGESSRLYHDERGKDHWKSLRFQDEKLSGIAQDVSNTGLGSVEEIYLSMIPPLSAENKLVAMDKIFDLARDQAKGYQQQHDWIRACEPYLWLLKKARIFPKNIAFGVKTIAVLLEHINLMAGALELSGSDDKHKFDNPVAMAKRKIEKAIDQWLGPDGDSMAWDILSYLRTLRQEQGRGWRFEAKPLPHTQPDAASGYPQAFEFDELHRLYTILDPSILDREIKAAMGRGQGVNQTDVFNWTPLHWAAARGNASAATQLLQHNADVNPQDLAGMTPLYYACRQSRRWLLKPLVQAGADVQVCGLDGVTPLHFAAMKNWVSEVECLLNAGASPDAKDHTGSAPLHRAASRGHTGCVALLARKAKVNLEKKKRKTALHLASAHGHDTVVEALIARGSNVHAKDRLGQTPLRMAAMHGHEDVVRALVMKKAKMSAKDELGHTPVGLAAARGHEEVVQYFSELKSRGRPNSSPGENHDVPNKLLQDTEVNFHARPTH